MSVNKFKLTRAVAAICVVACLWGALGCNKSTEDDEGTQVITILPNVAVTNFYIKANDKVAANLDSVFFSIDLDKGVIFNADSLPMGTEIDKLVVSATYSSYVTAATITMTGGKTREGEVDYYNNRNDSIDFSGRVVLTLSTEGEAMKKDYEIKVNVHKQNPDSLSWGTMAVGKLPSRLGAPRAQKSVGTPGGAVCLVEESDGTYTLSTSVSLMDNSWTSNAVSFGFTPQVRTLTAVGSRLYILDTAGALYWSDDKTTWTAAGETWTNIIGAYSDAVMGMKAGAQGVVWCQYPANAAAEKAIDPEFPIEGYSNLATIDNKWNTSPICLIYGGVTAGGKVSDITWAYDGREWVALNRSGMPAMSGVSLIPYYSFRYTSSLTYPAEFDVWMVLGGRKADNTLNRDVYISYDNGVSWRRGDSSLQLPLSFPDMAGCDNIVMDTEKSADLADGWSIVKKASPMRAREYDQYGNIVTWQCPYIYLLGGYDTDGRLYDTIWRGVLNRLTFRPIF